MAKGLLSNPAAIANFSPQMSQWLEQVLSGQFLGANPYINQLIAATEADAQRQFSESQVPMQMSGLNAMGNYGSALGQMASANAGQNFARGLSAQTSGIRSQDYSNERSNMMQALGMYTGQQDNSRSLLASMSNALTAKQSQLGAANIGAKASMYGADQSRIGQLGAANIHAGASRHATNSAAEQNYWNNLFNWSNMMNNYTGGPANGTGLMGNYGNAWSGGGGGGGWGGGGGGSPF